MKDSYNDIFKNKKRILVVLAHPDDAEIICGGTIARLISDDKEVRLIVTTSGGKGMQERTDVSEADFSTERIKSQKDGAKALGLKDDQVFNLETKDGEFENSLENIEKIVLHIRQFKPDIIITHNPYEVINTFSEEEGVRWVNHRDHRHTAIVTLDATYPYCRDTAFFPHHIKQGLKPHYVSEFLFSDSYTNKNAVAIEVTDFVDKKRAALKHHANALTDEEIEGFIDEIKQGDKYFEVLGYTKLD